LTIPMIPMNTRIKVVEDEDLVQVEVAVAAVC
jgi:hypothetical protein